VRKPLAPRGILAPALAVRSTSGSDERLWPAISAAAPVVVLVREAAEPAERWRRFAEELRRTRDLALVTASIEPGASPAQGRAAIGAALGLARRRAGSTSTRYGLIGVSAGAAAVLHAAAADPSVVSTVAVSPPAGLGDQGYGDAPGHLPGRFVLVLGSAQDPRSADALAIMGRIPNGPRVVRVPGGARGFDLLAAAAVQARVFGWLYSTLGPEEAEAAP
jgi:pimeloyl-ACP methyl ester carboxylesterase